MDTFAAISARRSIKLFDPEHVIAESEINKLMEAVLLTPTSFNIQNWRFVAVTDQKVKAEIRRVGWDQAQFSDCSLLVVICGDQSAYRNDPARYWKNAPQNTRDFLVKAILGAYDPNAQLRRDENLRSGGMAAQTLMLAAKAMGYDTCPMVGFDFREVARIVNLPPEHDIVMAVAVGRALAPARERGGQLSLDEVVVRDRF